MKVDGDITCDNDVFAYSVCGEYGNFNTLRSYDGATVAVESNIDAGTQTINARYGKFGYIGSDTANAIHLQSNIYGDNAYQINGLTQLGTTVLKIGNTTLNETQL